MLTARLDRIVARVHGDAPLAFLHAVLSQDVASLPPGRAATACYLDANAHVLAEVRVTHLPGGVVLLDAEPAAADALDTLAKIAGLSGCEIAIEPWTFTARRGDAEGLAEHEVRVRGSAIEIGVAWDGEGVDVLTPGASPPDEDGYEPVRIAAGRPRFGTDVTSELFVFETPLLSRAVSFTKGCYPGQESVARTVNLGAPKRRLAHLAYDGDAPAAGTEVEGGKITSAAGSYAIALLRADIPDGATVAGGQVRALP